MVENYVRGVAKTLSKSKANAPFWNAARHDWARCKIKLALFVQCNILPLMRAEARAKSRQVTPIDPANAAGRRETPMIKNMEDVQKMSKDSMEAAMKSLGQPAEANQAVAAEVADPSKKA